MRPKTAVSIAVMSVIAATDIIVLCDFLLRGHGDAMAMMKEVFFLFVGTKIPEHVGEIIKEMIDARGEGAPSGLVMNSGVPVHLDRHAAVQLCTDLAPMAEHIRNTVFGAIPGQAKDRQSEEWRRAKEQVVGRGQCTLIEIVSSHLPEQHPQWRVQHRLERKVGAPWYVARVLDDMMSPLAQMTVITLKSGRKVAIVASEYDGSPERRYLYYTDEQTAALWGDIFDQHFRVATTPKPTRPFYLGE